jgi:sulfatase maturation enzyme AslB (radical SAM superfamily)
MENIMWTVKIELTEGCNRRCVWCGATSFKKGEYKYMSIKSAKIISKDLSTWLNKFRIEFTLMGEPTLNRNAAEIISIFKKHNKNTHIMLTTNGSIISKGNIKANINKLFDNGLNVLIIDTYMPERDRLRASISKAGIENVSEFGDGTNIPWQRGKIDRRDVILMDDIRLLIKKGDRHKKFLNHCGMVDIDACRKAGVVIEDIRDPLVKKCVNPFRELCIKNNGDVILCCNDYSKSIIFGNILKMGSRKIWESTKFNLVRSLLYRRQRVFLPCSRCNFFGGFRQGIGLYDPFETKKTEDILDLISKEYRDISLLKKNEGIKNIFL